jgi:hypothetical protein
VGGWARLAVVTSLHCHESASKVGNGLVMNKINSVYAALVSQILKMSATQNSLRMALKSFIPIAARQTKWSVERILNCVIQNLRFTGNGVVTLQQFLVFKVHDI